MDTATMFPIAAFALIGLVNGVQLALNKQWQSFFLFLTAVLAGCAFGYFHWFGLPTMEMGFLLGIGSSGVYKGLQLLGGLRTGVNPPTVN